ncbi:MFS transporter, partial [[Eubacterium] cellulosolvens]
MKWRSKWLSAFFPINLAQGGSWPLIPLIILSLGGNVADIGITMFVYYSSTIISSKMWGRLSDHMGKRKIFIVTSFFSSSALYMIFSFLRSVPQIIFVSFILGFFLTAYPPSAIMLIIESHKKSEWAPYISSYNLFSGFGWSSGLILGAIWVNYYPLSSFFMVCSSASFLSGIAALFSIREPSITLEREGLPLVTFSLIERIIINFIHLPRSLELKRFIKTVKVKYVSDLSVYYGSLLIFFTASNA